MLVSYSILGTGRRRRRRLVGGSGFEKMGVASWHIRTLSRPNPTYIWAGLSLFTLEYGGQVVYMETHPKTTLCDPPIRAQGTHNGNQHPQRILESPCGRALHHHLILSLMKTFQKLTHCDVLSCVMDEFDTSLLFQLTKPPRYHTLMQLHQIVLYLMCGCKIYVEIIDVDHSNFLVKVEIIWVQDPKSLPKSSWRFPTKVP